MTDPEWLPLIIERFDKLETHVKETNGRVTKVERSAEQRETESKARSKFIKQIWIACSASAALGVTLLTLANGLHLA